MNKPEFIKSPACHPDGHCGTCRDREGGRSWRVGLSLAFTLPSDAPDFACPHALSWGHRPAGLPSSAFVGTSGPEEPCDCGGAP